MQDETKPDPAMSSDELAEIGVQRYGGFGWITALARELGVSRRTVQRWSEDGVMKPPAARAVRALAASPIDPRFTPQLGGDRRSANFRPKEDLPSESTD